MSRFLIRAQKYLSWPLKKEVTALISAAVLALSSCVYSTLPDFAALTDGANVTNFTGEKHKSCVIFNSKTFSGDGIVNIYLEGDGRPFLSRTKVSQDPTPLYPLALDLMQADQKAAFYVTRPCYHRHLWRAAQQDSNCHPGLWTTGRYSLEVIASLRESIQSIINQYGITEIRLIGYSGGATLALLLSNELPQVKEIVTVAGNLDIDAWTDFHDYDSLRESINPANEELSTRISYIHLVGEKDMNIPVHLGARVYSLPGHRLQRFEEFSHSCCWRAAWPEILASIDARQAESK